MRLKFVKVALDLTRVDDDFELEGRVVSVDGTPKFLAAMRFPPGEIPSTFAAKILDAMKSTFGEGNCLCVVTDGQAQFDLYEAIEVTDEEMKQRQDEMDLGPIRQHRCAVCGHVESRGGVCGSTGYFDGTGYVNTAPCHGLMEPR